MFIKHPTKESVLEISRYGEIRPCSVNHTHVDFYLAPHDPAKDRGEPDYTVVFDTEEERDNWFKKFSKRHTNI